MGIFRLKVVQRGTIIVDGVDSLEEAEEYIESCNPVDDVKWSGFLEAMQGGIELQKISIPEFMLVMDFADRILVRPAEIIKWLFLRGKVKQLDSEIGFDDMKEFADGYGFICEKEGISNKRMIDIEKEINDFFASDEFKKLSLSYDGVYRDYCNSEKFQIFDDTSIEPICRGVNKKIREIIDNAAINMFIRNNGIYMESDFSFGRKRDIQIGRLII